MKKIKSGNTEPERILRKAITNLGYRYRLNSPKLPGKPDIVLNRYRTAIFVDGEFWHGYKWKEKKKRLKSNKKY